MRKSRIECLVGLLSALVVRAQARLAARHLRQGYPQLAVFAFDHIGARINAFGRYEHDELATLAEFLKDRDLLQGACIDVGANIGNHAVFFATLFREVHAFEPAPAPFVLLRHNTCHLENVHCHPYGLSSHHGQATLTAPRDNVGAGRIEEGKAHQSPRAAEISLVELDRFPLVHGLDIGLIKIDVEGHELKVLDGAVDTISRVRPVIVFEQQPEDMDGGTSKVIERLRSLGYAAFYEFARSPQISVRPLNILWRLLRGESCCFRHVSAFEKKYYGMLVALS